MTQDALLEIGTEELPARFIPSAMSQWEVLTKDALATRHLAYGHLSIWGSPRRLVLLIEGLAVRSEEIQTKVVGPPVAQGKDTQGNWTPVAIGFAKKQGVGPHQLLEEEGRLCAILRISGASTRTILGEVFPQLISGLVFPKMMTWNASGVRFARPIRSLLALYGADVVRFSYAGIKSGKWTTGLHTLSIKKITVSNANRYVTLLKNHCVMVDATARREAIKRLAEQAVKKAEGTCVMRPALLEEVTHMVEHPAAVLGSFDSAYLSLPPEVLRTCLEHHQKFFPVTDVQGKLLPHFVGIRNGMSVHQEGVREGYERVLAARLADAQFFFRQDTRTRLSDKVEKLKGVIFQAQLGTLFEKKERVKKLARQLAVYLEDKALASRVERVAELCKADLVTEMVFEFPELQGVMGRIYAREEGEPAEVAHAIEEHYWPITTADPLPTTPLGAVGAVADKMDTLAGDFCVGLIPTGSADPYGLRRAAVGVLRILLERRWPIRLENLVDQALDLQPISLPQARPAARTALLSFLRQRLSAIFEEKGFRFDEIEAVLETGLGELSQIEKRLEALRDVRQHENFEPLSIAFKRAANILRQAHKAGVDGDTLVRSELFQETSEGHLFEAFREIQRIVHEQVSRGAYQEALQTLAGLREPLDRFFEGVMVMVEDTQLRSNRLALLSNIVQLFRQVADFSQLQSTP